MISPVCGNNNNNKKTPKKTPTLIDIENNWWLSEVEIQEGEMGELFLLLFIFS